VLGHRNSVTVLERNGISKGLCKHRGKRRQQTISKLFAEPRDRNSIEVIAGSQSDPFYTISCGVTNDYSSPDMLDK
jgi:hypothetical protein